MKTNYFNLIIIALTTFLLTSCYDKEIPSSKNLIGTNWRCIYFTVPEIARNYDYYEIRIISTSALEIWEKEKNANVQKIEDSFIYSIKDKEITITNHEGPITGTIDEKEITLTDEEITLVFTKL